MRKKLSITLLFIIALFLFSHGETEAATYIVSKSGSSYSTIQAGVNVAQNPGDIVLVSSGTYPELVASKFSGAAQNPITIKAEGEVVVKGFSLNHNYLTLDGFEITNNKTDSGVVAKGDNVRIINNIIHHIRTGIDITGSNILVENNDISHSFDSTADGIRFFGRGHIIRKNYVHDITNTEAPGSHVDCFQTYDTRGTSSITNDVIIENNVCMNVDHQCLMASQTTYKQGGGIIFQNNVCGNNGAQAIYFVDMSDCVARNNIILESVQYNGMIIQGAAHNFQAYNNIFKLRNAALPYTLREYDGVNPANFYSDYNLRGLTTYSPPSGWNEPHSLWNKDPMFVNAAGNNYHLTTGSPACGTGKGGADMGIYENDCLVNPTRSPTSSFVPGDANGDGKVDGKDYIVWLYNYGTVVNIGASKGDFNNDTNVDGLDYVVWLNNYGN